jgi:hypothetical protein
MQDWLIESYPEVTRPLISSMIEHIPKHRSEYYSRGKASFQPVVIEEPPSIVILVYVD